MSLEFQQFEKPAPQIFSPFMDTYLNKQLRLSEDGTSPMNFTDLISEMMEELDQEDHTLELTEDTDDGTTQSKKNKKSQVSATNKDGRSNAASITLTRELSKFQSGASFIPYELLAEIDQNGQRSNFENTKDANYINYADKLKTPFFSRDDMDELALEIFGNQYVSEMLDEDGNAPAAKNTLPHNINIYGIDSNIFKKADSKNRELFETSEFFSALHNQFMGPRAILDRRFGSFYSTMCEEMALMCLSHSNYFFFPLVIAALDMASELYKENLGKLLKQVGFESVAPHLAVFPHIPYENFFRAVFGDGKIDSIK